MSASQTWFGAAAVNCRASRLGASGKAWLLSVVVRNRRLCRARMPCRASGGRPGCAPPGCPRPAARHARGGCRSGAGCRHGRGGSRRPAPGCSAARRAFRPAPPRVVAAGADLQHRAHHPHQEHRPVVLDEPEPHLGGPEKMAMAFFKMSRSICARSSSFCRRRISACSADGAAVAPPGRAGRTPAQPPSSHCPARHAASRAGCPAPSPPASAADRCPPAAIPPPA